MTVRLEVLAPAFSICKAARPEEIDFSAGFLFVGKTDNELSVVCPTDAAPRGAAAREDGWRAMRVAGALDFGLTGILARLSSALADAGVPLFAVSTYDTDYILVRRDDLARALAALAAAGFEIAGE